MTFPDEPLNLAVELKIGDTWVDIKKAGHVYTRDPITITRGRQDEGSRADPSTCSMTLDNRDGRYCPRNVLGPYYGLIGRNTPIRVSAGAGPAALTVIDADDGATAPDQPGLDITGDLDVRFYGVMDWTDSYGGLVSKYGDEGQLSWDLRVDFFTRKLLLWWSPTGLLDNGQRAYSTVRVPPSRVQAVRAALDVDNGTGGRTVRFYTADTIDGPWTQLGDPVSAAGTTSIHAGNSPLKIGGSIGAALDGRVYAVTVHNGIDGPAVAAPDFRTQAEGATGFTDSLGNVWTVAGNSQITNRTTRFMGEIPSWPIRWGPSEQDGYVQIEAAGITRRLGQGRKPLKSALFRAISGALADTDPTHKITAYWPMEDGDGATQAAAAVPGVPPLKAVGPVTFSAEPSGGTSGGVAFGDGGRLVGATPSTGGQWQIIFWFDLPADMGTDAISPIVQWRTPGSSKAVRWDLYTGQGINGLMFLECADDDNNIVLSAGGSQDVRGRGPVQIRIEGFNNGSSFHQVRVYVDGVLDISTATSTADTATTPTSIGVNLAVSAGTEFSGNVSHLIVTPWSVWHTAIFARDLVPAGTGYRGETAGDRFERLCEEESIPSGLLGDTDDTEPMGPQLPAPVLDLLADCEDADGGTLYEARDDLALRYRTRAADYNTAPAVSLDYHDQVAYPLEPVDDDQNTRNDVTVQRVGGSSARVVIADGPLSVNAPPDGVGTYDESLTLNVAADDRLLPIAGWRARLGTVDEARYPVVRVKLHKHPDLIPAVTAMDMRSRIHLTGLPAWEPPGTVDLLADGYTEVLEPRRWTIEYNTVPGSPWRTGILDDPVLGRADTDGSALVDALGTADTALTVEVTQGPFWTTDPADLPFDVATGGEVMTATAIGAAGTAVLDNFATTVANGWGTTDTGQAWTVAAGAAGDFSAANNTGGVINSSTTGVERGVVVPVGTAHQSLLVHSNTPVIPTGGAVTWGCYLRWADAGNYYWVGVEIGTNSSLTLRIRKRVGGTLTLITSAVSATAHALSPWRILRAEVAGSTIRAKVWSADAAEPGWEVQATDTALTSGGSAGCVVRRETGNANATTTAYDIFTTTPRFQPFTVTRSVNGISKAHPAGADIRLAQPTIIAL